MSDLLLQWEERRLQGELVTAEDLWPTRRSCATELVRRINCAGGARPGAGRGAAPSRLHGDAGPPRAAPGEAARGARLRGARQARRGGHGRRLQGPQPGGRPRRGPQDGAGAARADGADQPALSEGDPRHRPARAHTHRPHLRGRRIRGPAVLHDGVRPRRQPGSTDGGASRATRGRPPRSWPGSRWPSTTYTARTSFTATSSPATFSSRTTSRSSATSAWPSFSTTSWRRPGPPP